MQGMQEVVCPRVLKVYIATAKSSWPIFPQTCATTRL
jgi:hypothetical protein